ncbi:hypothetical protein NHX12_004937 [Muraenolepis orangiensis]|uniref:WW domain-containing protein n=1 Tax=Muraenolepis orangiensis TaxID=630683 RepID=A0A9Q0DW87_9TELE|nr:hypothetical protein NHX12_004937 [Muraenolepis orangiensis]
MVMHARKPARVSDGCNDRRHSQPYQPHKSQPKSQSGGVHRYDKVRDGVSEPTPPYKMLRRSDESPVSRPGDGTAGGHGRPKASHALGGKNGTSGSPQENPHNNNGAQHTDSHAPQSRPAERRQEPADDWTEHISSSGKKYYYNCRTEVSQWEKPRDLLEREQRQKDPSKTATNNFPRDMDYRQEALQDKATAKSTSGDQPTGVDMAKINEVLAAAVTQASLRSMLHKLLAAGPSGYNLSALLSQAAAAQHSSQAQQSSQSPVSLASDTPSPRPYSSPRSASTQSSAASQKPMMGGGSSAGSAPSQSRLSAPCSFTPSLATHFDENLIRHVQGWPGEHTEKQAARLREDYHNMGSLYMSEICTELKNLRSLVRVCEIQATLREQRILFLRQQSKELDKLKNQNSYMV